MRRGAIWQHTYRLFWLIEIALSVVIVALAAADKVDVEALKSRWKYLADAVESAQYFTWCSIPVLVLLMGFAEVLKKAIGPPWVCEAVHELLDQFQKQVFKAEKKDPPHEHRVTLFKIVSWRWRGPWCRCLVPVERSGLTTLRTRACFRIPDDPGRAEGVAGRTWVLRRPMAIHGLPNLVQHPNDRDAEDYAKKTGVQKKWVFRARKKRPLARSFCGIYVEIKGKPWGVIVIDSRKEKEIGPRANRAYSTIAGMLGTLLERWGR